MVGGVQNQPPAGAVAPLGGANPADATDQVGHHNGQQVRQEQARPRQANFLTRTFNHVRNFLSRLFGGARQQPAQPRNIRPADNEQVQAAGNVHRQPNTKEGGSGVDAERERGNRQEAIKTLTPKIADRVEELLATDPDYELTKTTGTVGLMFFKDRELSSIVDPTELKARITQFAKETLKFEDARHHLSRNIYGHKLSGDNEDSRSVEDSIEDWSKQTATNVFEHYATATLFKEVHEPILKEQLLTKMESSEATAILSAVDAQNLSQYIEERAANAVQADPRIKDLGLPGLKTTIDKAIERFVNRGVEIQKAVASFEGIDNDKRLILQKFVKDTVFKDPYYHIKSPQKLKAAVSCSDSVMKLVTASKDQIPESIVSLAEMMNSEENSLIGEEMSTQDRYDFATTMVNLAYRTSGMRPEPFFAGLKNNLGQFELMYDAALHVSSNTSNPDASALASSIEAVISGFGASADTQGVLETRDQLWGESGKDVRGMGRGVDDIGFKDFPKALQDALKAKGEIDVD